MAKTPQELFDDCNELAREFYASHGCEVAAGYRFDLATHPQEQGMWNLACIAYEFIDGTDIEEVIKELDGN